MINELIDESLAMSGERRCLHFSPQAARIWTDYYNDVESKLGIGAFKTLPGICC